VNYEDMSDDQRLVFLATAKRVTAKEIWVVRGKNRIRNGWFGRLRGYNIGELQESKEAAIAYAKALRDKYAKMAKEKGLLKNADA